MLNKTFTHLHVHDEYSQLDGFGQAKNYITRAKELGFEYLGLTNHGNIDGLLNWQKECDKQRIKSVLGCEAYIVPDATIKPKKEFRGHITLLIKNHTGFRELCKLLTYANLTGFHYRPRIDYPSLLKADLSGFIIMTACAGSFLTHNDWDSAFNFFLELKKRTEVYLEIMPHNIKVQKNIHTIIKSIKEYYGEMPLVATNDCHYIDKEDWQAQEVLLAIQTKAKWKDKNRFKFGFKGLHLRTADEMVEAFEKQGHFSRPEYLMAMRNTIKIAKQCCQYRIPKQNISLPPIKESWGPKEHYKELERRTMEGLDNLNIKEIERDDYKKRANTELQLINRKKFARYFLIVLELIEWAKKQGILIGPGRGSVGGSLVAYLTGITKVDPIKYGLLFERFIAEDRIDYPDVDIDFEDIRREEVVRHIEDLYGKYNTSGITTFGKMKSRAVVRDVGRVFEIPYKDIDEFAKIIISGGKKEEQNRDINFVDLAIKETIEGKRFKRKYPTQTEFAIKLEGQIRQAGQHAAAIIISADDLRKGDRCNLCMRKDRIMCNWDMDDSEYMGLMKLDILSLNTLTVINETLRLIQKNHFPDKKISDNYLEQIPLNDKTVLKEINKGNTFGMFHLSASFTTDIVKQVQVRNFEDIATAIALSRPGPFDSGMTEEYIKRKKNHIRGISWKYKHPIYEKITKDTYGVLVFQEQVMQVISEVAGLSYSMADKIRKIIGKKRDPKEFKKYWKIFLEGCLKKRTMDELEAEKFWEGLKNWASYGFNKAHSIEYAMLGYWTGWLKLHYPTEFICAHLSFGTESAKEDLMEEARNLGMKITPPKIGVSDSHRWIAKNGNLYCPFIEVKGIGDKAAIKCTQRKTSERKQRSFFDEEQFEPIAKPGSALDKILRGVGAYDENDWPREAQKFFSFSLSGDKNVLYPHLLSSLNFNFPDDELKYYLTLDKALKNNLPTKRIIKKKRFRNLDLLKCQGCELRAKCKGPVLPSQGIYNVAIIGEAPGPQEDHYGIGFYEKAPAGELLWKELERYGLKRALFHITNVNKCYPGRKIKTPNKHHIKACQDWLLEELKSIDCRLALCFGNTCVKAFTDRDSGITDMSGKTEWIEDFRLWACWCIHPAAVKHNPKNRKKFEEGIKNFVEKFNLVK